MNIAEIASREFEEVDVEDRFGKIRAVFERENPKGIIVTNEGNYRGVLTERQILRSRVDDRTKAESMMRSAPQIERTADVRDVARMLVEGGTKVAPVFDADRLWGIVTVDGILAAVLDNLDALAIDQIHSDDVVTVSQQTTIGRVINLLREHGISRLPVVNGRDLLVGILTTYDLGDMIIRDMDKPTVGERGGDIERILDLPASDVMNAPVVTIALGVSVKEAVELMLENDYAGLVVTDPDDDRVIEGVVTKSDVLRALAITEDDHIDVQITNIDLLDTLSRDEIRASITEVADKYQRMRVHHAHVRFQEHKERFRGVPLIGCQIRLRTSVGQVAGSGEGFGADGAFPVALDKLERNVLELKGIKWDEHYEGQLLRKIEQL